MLIALTAPSCAVRATQGQGLMPDNSSRFSKDGRMIHHFVSVHVNIAWITSLLILHTDGNFNILPIHRRG